MSHKLIIFTAPSGAGKTTLVRHLLKTIDVLAFSVSATTRTCRASETNGKDYYFINKDEFLYRVGNGEFVEWQEVYDGNYYGTLKSEISLLFSEGKSIIFDVDVEGAKNIKKMYGNQALTVFVKPPNIATLRERLMYRHTETDHTLQQRLDKAIKELACEADFDAVILNDNLDQAKKDAFDTASSFLKIPIETPSLLDL
jgi:guanylate kinase